MPFIKTKCVLENKTHKAPRLILFLQIRKKNKTPPQKKTVWGKTVHKKTRRGRTLARVGRKGEMA